MEWNGAKTKPEKYSNSTYRGELIGFVSISKVALYEDDGELVEHTFAHLYDVDENPMDMYIATSNKLSSCALADYILCDIQNERDIEVNK